MTASSVITTCLTPNFYTDNQALTLLTTLLTTGTATSQSPALLPTRAHLALCATLSTHPTLTNRAKAPDRAYAAHLALSARIAVDETTDTTPETIITQLWERLCGKKGD